MTTAPSPPLQSAPEKLPKLFARLESDSEGERVATVEAIGRVLTASGLRWMDVAEVIAGATGPNTGAQPRQPKEPEDLESIIAFALEHPESLYAREIEFLEGALVRVQMGQELSTKQFAWIEKINWRTRQGRKV
jgi:hypothetical protein